MQATKLLACLVAGLVFSAAYADAQPPSSGQNDVAKACVALQQLKLPNVVSLTAQNFADGEISLPTAGDHSSLKKIAGLPPFCRVQITAKPAPASSIRIELWLPAAGWNGRFLGTGNGGGAGSIGYGSMGPAIKRGFAVANTDMGTAPGANQIAAFPDKWADFGYRATHVMTLLAKSVIASFYRSAATHAYFVGCSTGGQQAMSEAQRYPADYNGIIAGAPANNRTHLHSEFLWHYQATHQAEAKSLLPPELLTQITRAVVASCAGKDGGAPSDNFLTDPRACKFDPRSLAICSETHAAGCLTPEQATALAAIYQGPVNPKTGERIYAPLPFGAEASALGIGLQEDWSTAVSLMYPFQWALGPHFEPAAFDFNHDEDALDDKLAPILNANSPDLTAFQKHGGKLIAYTGTADPIVPFPDAINYYERVVAFTKRHPRERSPAKALATTQQFFRYYVVPGMAHCGGGPGLDNIGQAMSDRGADLLHVLETWSEGGSAPHEIAATGMPQGEGAANAGGSRAEPLKRNLCPYPEFPTYKGGDARKETSFQCEARPRGGVAIPAARYLR